MRKANVTHDACFACTTPYQIMGAVSIVSAIKNPADLIVFGFFDGWKDLAERIRKTKLFRDVIAVGPGEYKAPGRSKALWQMMRARTVINSLLPEDRIYEVYYASSRAHIKNILLYELLQRNRKLRIVMYDDGMGTYAGDSHVLNTTNPRKKAEKLLGWDLYRPERMEYQVYEPELFSQPDRYAACPVKQMPKPADPETMAVIARVFGITAEDAIGEKVIVFDPLRSTERRDILPQLDNCYQEITAVFGKENVVIKPHPRSEKTPDTDARIYTGTGIPMEALYAGMEDLEERLLITYASTAVFTPKMLFGKEPRVIALFRIFDGETGSEWQTQFDKIRSLYSDKGRMMAPKDRRELTILLQEICRKNN